MPQLVAFFIGALIITFLLIRAVRWLLRKIGQDHLGLAHVLVAAVSIVAVGYGMADGGEPQFVVGAIFYGAACLLWFLVDLFRWERNRAPKS